MFNPLHVSLPPPCCRQFLAVVLLNSKETQAELGWTSYPPNGVSIISLAVCFSFLLHCFFLHSLFYLPDSTQLVTLLFQTFSSLCPWCRAHRYH